MDLAALPADLRGAEPDAYLRALGGRRGPLRAVRATRAVGLRGALTVVRALGSVEVLAEKTRIAWHGRMSFAAFHPKVAWLDGHLVLGCEVPSPRWRRVQVFSTRNVLRVFRLTGPDDVDGEFARWLAEAYAVGQQRHRGR